MKQLWEAYEIWCYFKVVDVLNGITAGQSIDQRDVFTVVNLNEAVPRLRDDSTIFLRMEDGREMRVTYHRTFRPLGTGRADPVVSVSSAKVPDIVVQLEGRRLMFLDAKYRLDSEDAVEEGPPSARGGPQQTDIDAMHVYRDAIRTQDDLRAADWAYILYPGSETVLQDQRRLGAMPLIPGDDGALRGLLEWWINEPA